MACMEDISRVNKAKGITVCGLGNEFESMQALCGESTGSVTSPTQDKLLC